MITLTKEQALFILHCLANATDHMDDCMSACEDEDMCETMQNQMSEFEEAAMSIEEQMN
jgi:hypothetical protein